MLLSWGLEVISELKAGTLAYSKLEMARGQRGKKMHRKHTLAECHMPCVNSTP